MRQTNGVKEGCLCQKYYKFATSEIHFTAEFSASRVCALGVHACFVAWRSPHKTGWVTLSVPCFAPVFKVLPAKGECKNTYPRS